MSFICWAKSYEHNKFHKNLSISICFICCFWNWSRIQESRSRSWSLPKCKHLFPDQHKHFFSIKISSSYELCPFLKADPDLESRIQTWIINSFYQFVLVSQWECAPNFIQIHSQLLKLCFQQACLCACVCKTYKKKKNMAHCKFDDEG